jgi:DNA-binding CsgD family transcriptional regulator
MYRFKFDDYAGFTFMDCIAERLVDDLYESFFDETLLNKFVADLANATHSSFAGFVRHDAASNRAALFSAHGTPFSELSPYDDSNNLQQQLDELVSSTQPDGVTYVRKHVELVKKQSDSGAFHSGFGERATMRLADGNKHPVTAVFDRDQGLGPYSQQEKNMFSTLLPHIKRRFRLIEAAETDLFDKKRQWARFEYYHFGVLIFDNNNELTFTNNLAETFLNSNDGFVNSPNVAGVRASIKSENDKLQNMIKENAEITTSDSEFEQMSFMQVSRPSGKRPYNLQVVHIPKKLAHMKSYPTLMIFIYDTAATFNLRKDELQTLYYLTNAEAQVAVKISQGKSLKQCAIELGHAVSTSRNLLKKVFAKTGTGRQNELVSLLLSSTSITVPKAPTSPRAISAN